MGKNIPRTNRLEERKSSFGKEKCLFFYNYATVNDWYFIFTFGSVIVCSCFISTAHWKIQPFSPVSPLTESKTKGFCRLFFWKFKKKNINRFLWHSLWIPFPQAIKLFHNNWLIFFLWLCSSLRLIKRRALLSFMVVSSPRCGGKYSLFSSFPLGGIHG